MNHFWKWVRNKVPDDDEGTGPGEERTLFLEGAIADNDSWFENDVTPAAFRDELNSGTGDITVWINSPGGDCFAAAQIYNLLRDYRGKVTVKIDGLAASAASVIAMAGDEVLVSPVSMLMLHNPATVAMGDHNDMQKAIEMLDSVKDSIIDAYAEKTGLSRNKLWKLMEDETWLDSTKAVEMHFADAVIERDSLYSARDEPAEEEQAGIAAAEKKHPMLFCQRLMDVAVTNRIMEKYAVPEEKEEPPETTGRSADDCDKRLELIGTMIGVPKIQ